MRGESGHAGRRLVGAVVAAVALVVGAIAIPSYAQDDGSDESDGTQRTGSLLSQTDRTKKRMVARALEARPHVDPPGTAPHVHDDPRTKNALSRSTETGAATQDPTGFAAKVRAAVTVAQQRAMRDPKLTTVRPTQRRTRLPRDVYAMANGCYALGGQPVYFKPTDLGDYLLYTRDARFVVSDGTAATPSDATIWTAAKTRHRFTFTNAGRRLTLGGASSFRLTRTGGCTAYPEAGVDIDGDPHAGVTGYQEVRGWIDAHTHGMAFEFLGGDAHCGKPWDRFGAPYALVDCPDHTATGGFGGVLGDVLSGKPYHDPVGWPTFKDWPAPESLTHEGTYYRWLERAWRGGERVFVNLLVENDQLCKLYPLKHNSCDDMDSIRLQAKDMYAMQDYIDAQAGGPGKGFYRIVKNPFQAREVINAGKLAVVMGIETSVPFGCTVKLDVPQCDVADIDRQMDEVRRLGVRQMELVNKFDNALSGVAGDNGAVGTAVNAANFLETGSFWDMEHCDPADGESHDRDQVSLVPSQAPIDGEQQDALFGAVAQLAGINLALPVYAAPHHCNSRGLTTLGEHTVEALAQRHMIFDPDHMSVKARASALDTIDRLGYAGVVSSHSWATPDAYPRIYGEGGFITPYAGDSTGFVDKWRRHVGWADPRYYFGIGFGADMNGLGAQGDPRGAGVADPVTYPFTGINGITVDRQTAGQRTWDINVDGVAQYGLYPDWIQDLGEVAGSDAAAITEDMSRGPEAYLQMWERAEGIHADSCRNPALQERVARIPALVHRGMSTKAVMEAVGQPYTRLGRTYGFCAETRAGRTAMMKVRFTAGGRVLAVRRAA